jgi:hypothetical protein
MSLKFEIPLSEIAVLICPSQGLALLTALAMD